MPDAGPVAVARGCVGRPRRGDRRRGRWRSSRRGDLRGAQQQREPARARAAEPRDAAGGAPRVVRPQLARGGHDDPRRAQGRADRGAALVSLQRRRDAVRDRQLRRHARGRRRRAGAARRRDPRPHPEGAGRDRLRRRDAGRVRGLGRPPRVAARPRPDRGRSDRRQRRCADALHVGHDRQAEGCGAHDQRPGHRRRAARRAGPRSRRRGAHHDGAALPLGAAGVRA